MSPSSPHSRLTATLPVRGHVHVLALAVALAVIGALAISTGPGVTASSQYDLSPLVPRRGFLVSDPGGQLRVLSRRGEVVRRVPGAVAAPYGAEGIALAHDRRHAFVSVERGDRLPALYRVNLATGARRSISSGISPVVSPHGTRLAYVSVIRRRDIQYKASLVIRDLRTGEDRRVPLGQDTPLGTPPENIINWSTAGGRVAFDDGPWIRQVRLSAPHAPISKPLAPRGWVAPAFLDSRTLVALSNCCIGRHQRLMAIDQAGRQRRFATLGAPAENLLRLRPGHLLAVTALYRLTMVSYHHTHEIAGGVTAATR
jgi:hypothetical protein